MDHPPLRLVFAGTPDFAVPPLAGLLEAGHRPVAVYTQPDRPAGRGRALQASAVKKRALENNLPVYQPGSFKQAGALDTLASLEADLMIVVAYGLILPQAVLDIPRLGCWNIHASLLPRWRGAAPIQRAIEAGDEETGVCIMQMDAGLDTGPVYSCHRTPIAADETAASLQGRLAMLGAGELLHCLRLLQRGQLPEPQAQNHEFSVYASKLTKDEAELDWQRPALELDRQVRAFNPWPVCWTTLNGKRLRVWAARALSDSSSQPPGTVITHSAHGVAVATGAGSLLITELQPEGGRRISAADFRNAQALETGQALGNA
jgi:methionyl-tRNA formyltransferase